MAFQFSAVLTVGGYPIDEVSSSLQKCVRRSDLDGALFWCSELDLTGYSAYAWKRLLIVCSEDVGISDPLLPAVIRALYENWKTLTARKDTRHRPERLSLLHAVTLLCRASKSRLVDNACTVFYSGPREQREVEDHCLDKHTTRGRQMGRGFRHFFEEAARLIPPSTIDGPYADRAKAISHNAKKDLFDNGDDE